MRIAQLGSNEECVPPPGYGGTELIVSLLTDGLVERGHDVTLFATGNSQTSARLLSVREHPLRNSGEAARRWASYDIRLLMRLREMRDQFDIVHNHMGWQALPWLPDLGLPVVTTNHNPIKKYSAPIYLEYRDLPYVAISNAYHKMNYPDQLNYVATIYNGIDTDAFHPNGDSRSYLLFIGRLCEDKGAEPAIQIAKQLNLPIVLAGKVDAADRQYFEDHVRPHLHPPDVEFIGEVGPEQKDKLYRHAIATVYPINFEEPFGLVMAESLAAGTPVMALDRGSVREVLSDGDTAVIGQSIQELVKRFPEVQKISQSQCRARVENLFSKGRMIDAYEQLYARLIEQHRKRR